MTLTKIDDRGLNYPLEFQDNEELRIGTNNKVQLRHNGSHFYFNNNNGNIYFRLNNSTNAILVRGSDGSVELYHNGTKMLETTSTGIQLGGTLDTNNNNIHFNDNVSARFGTGQDFDIYHDGSYSRINSTSHGLIVRTDMFHINNGANNESLFKATNNGAVELYYNNVKKLETQIYGLTVAGSIYIPDNEKFITGTANDLQIYHTGSGSRIQNFTGTFSISNEANEIQINKGSSEYMARFITDGAVELYYDNSKKFNTDANGVQVTGRLSATTNISATTYVYSGGQVYSDEFITATTAASSILRLKSRNASGTEQTILKGTNGGSVELFHNGTKKFETTSTGLKTESSSNLNIHLLKTGSQDTLIQNTGQTEICAASGGGSGQRIAFKIGASTGSLSDVAKFTDTGLCFGSDTAAANALDDYEEGSFTPNLLVNGSETGITYSYQVGQYVKIGRQVTVNMYIALSNKGSSSGNIHLGNLPFTVQDSLAGTQHEASGSVGYISGLGTNAIFFTVTAVPSPNALMLTLLDSAKSATDHATQAHLTNSFGVRCSCTYFTND